MKKCKNCGEPIVRFPIKAEPDKPLLDNINNRTIIWKNLFKMDTLSILFIICILLLVAGYKHDTAKCDDVITHPCEFCDYTGCCNYNTYTPTTIDLEHEGIFNLSALSDKLNNK